MDTASAGGTSAPAQPNDQGMGIAHDDNTSDRQTQESELAKMWFQNLVKAGAAPHGGGCGGNEKDMAEHVYDAMGPGGGALSRRGKWWQMMTQCFKSLCSCGRWGTRKMPRC